MGTKVLYPDSVQANHRTQKLSALTTHTVTYSILNVVVFEASWRRQKCGRARHQTLINTFAALSFRESGQHVTISRLLGIILYTCVEQRGRVPKPGLPSRPSFSTAMVQWCNGAAFQLIPHCSSCRDQPKLSKF